MRMFKALVAAALWAVGAVMAQSAAPKQEALLPAELFFKAGEVLDARLSPSGKKVAVTTTIGGTRVGLFVWDLDDLTKVQRAARFSDVDVARFWWVNDDRLVFSVIDLSEGSGYQYAPGLYSVRPGGDELRQLVMRQGIPIVSSPTLGRPPLRWNHVLLQVPDGGGDEVVIGEYDLRANEIEAVIPMRLNVVTGRTTSLDLGAPKGVTGWMFDGTGQARVAVVRGQGRRQVHWRGPGETAWRLLDDSPILSVPFSPAFVDNQGGLYVTRVEGVERYRVLTRFDFATGKPARDALVRTPGFDFRGSLLIEPSGALRGVRVTTDAETTVWFDDNAKRLQKLADDRLPGYVNLLTIRRCASSDCTMLVRSYSDRDPGHLWIYRERDGKSQWQLVSRVHSGIDPSRMAHVDFERIRARDGRELPVWLTLPAGRKAGDGGPAVVMVHGGPRVRGSYWRWDAMNQFLASRGYVVISPEFRGSSGYGAAHEEAGWKEWGRAMQNDVADAARWAMSKGWADRVCIAGASYGGYATLMGLVRDGDLYKCGVAWVAVADLFLFLQGSWWIRDDLGDEGRRYDLPTAVGDPEKDAEMLRPVSPVLQAAHIKRPLLLAYGESDRRVPIAHGERLRKAMREAGNDPVWVSYPEEGHSWLKLETHVDFAKRFEGFLAQHLK